MTSVARSTHVKLWEKRLAKANTLVLSCIGKGTESGQTHSAGIGRRATALVAVESGFESIGLVGSNSSGGGEGNAGEEGNKGDGELHFD